MNKKTNNICPVCESSKFENLQKSESFDYKGNNFVIDSFEYSRCCGCGFELISPAQVRRNELRVKDQFRRIDGLLTGKEIKAIRKKYGLTQENAAHIFGGGPSAFSKYERGEVIQSKSMDTLLRLANEYKEVYDLILEKHRSKYRRTVTKKRTIEHEKINVAEVNLKPPSNILIFQSKQKELEHSIEAFEEKNTALG
ncbi:MAG: type II toxin-antitoxin system MqsA family antitoxin [Gammaproteobacteria bacterium]|nr:type II toxin-antitoxin system MqsA family antitoxin [Gammaproteobacteria bacterium]